MNTERQCKSFTGTKQVKTLKRNKFLLSGKIFDKKLHFCACQYRNKFIENLETITTTIQMFSGKKLNQLCSTQMVIRL